MKIRATESGIQLYDFTAVEAYKIARVIEREGIRFYRHLLEKTVDAKVKEVLQYLRDAEEEHLNLFDHLLEDVQGKKGGRGEEDDLLASVDAGIFALPESELAAADFEKALQIGIIIEKRSLAFYLEVLQYTESSDGKHALRRVIDEERSHWEHLKQLAR